MVLLGTLDVAQKCLIEQRSGLSPNLSLCRIYLGGLVPLLPESEARGRLVAILASNCAAADEARELKEGLCYLNILLHAAIANQECTAGDLSEAHQLAIKAYLQTKKLIKGPLGIKLRLMEA